MISPSPIKETNSLFKLPDHTCQRLTLAEIILATNNFDKSLVIGCGGFGDVYKSVSKFGSVNEIAIKRLRSTSSQGANEFEAEVEILSKLRHGNLVPLIGYCCEGKEMVLVYEFMPNGTLEDHLHRSVTELSWLQRLKICIGAARGLDYLHAGTSTQHGVMHRDVKTSNILLDSNFEAKISDFGLAKVGTVNQTRTHMSTLVKGTFGYLDPCYFQSGKLTRKSNVYAFGVVLFEVLTGKRALDPTFDEDQPSLAVYAHDHIKRGRLNDIVNHRLMVQISKKCLKEFTSLAVQCLHDQPKQRPTMAEIVVKLESIRSRESESAVSGVCDGRFFNKIRYFFTGKADLMPPHLERNISVPPEQVFRGADALFCYKTGLVHLEQNQLPDALSCFDEALLALKMDNANGAKIKAKVTICARYKMAVTLLQEIARLQKVQGPSAIISKDEIARLSRHLGSLPLQAKHRINCIPTAIKRNIDMQNYDTPSRCLICFYICCSKFLLIFVKSRCKIIV